MMAVEGRMAVKATTTYDCASVAWVSGIVNRAQVAAGRDEYRGAPPICGIRNINQNPIMRC